MKSLIVLSVLVLAGCVSADTAPSQVIRSTKSRQVVVDCLINRLGSLGAGSKVEVDEQPDVTTVVFKAHLGSAIGFITTTRDEGTGSVTEVRAKSSIGAAKYCFSEIGTQ